MKKDTKKQIIKYALVKALQATTQIILSTFSLLGIVGLIIVVVTEFTFYDFMQSLWELGYFSFVCSVWAFYGLATYIFIFKRCQRKLTLKKVYNDDIQMVK